jgi:recombination protein RecA
MAFPKKQQQTQQAQQPSIRISAKESVLASAGVKPPTTQTKNESKDFSDALISGLNKEFGGMVAYNLGSSGSDAPTIIKQWIPTGSKQLDIIIKNAMGGGLPGGRVIEVQGPPSIGKSHLAFECCKSVQKMGGIVVYIDTENATSLDNLRSIGINPSKQFVFIQENCIEKIFSICESVIKRSREIDASIPVFIVWDSVAQSSPKAELEGDYEQQTIGLAARVLSKGMRKIVDLIGDKLITLLLVNQQRQKIGVMYGDNCVSPNTKIKVRRRVLA